MDVVARGHCCNIRVVTYGGPDLLLELPSRNVIAKERVVWMPVSNHSFSPYLQSTLTAVEATWEINRSRAVSQRAADAGAVAPHHLREVAPRCVEVRVVVGILGLFLVPAMDSGAGKLYPSVVAVGNGLH